MAGGRGQRFWPVSRRERPKPFLKLVGDETLLQLTVRRCMPLIPPERIWIIGAAAHIEMIKESVPELPVENLIGEPEGRNTAPCLAVAGEIIRRRDPDAVIAALPADHLIKEEEKFRSLLGAAAVTAERSAVFVTIGLAPTKPHTGYGYIHLGEQRSADPEWPVYAVSEFVEKPDLATAQQYLDNGGYYWNGGIFVVATKTLSDMVTRQQPVMADILKDFPADNLSSFYGKLPSVSIDYGLLEKADNLVCIPAQLTWSDVGSWASLYDYLADGPAENVSTGKLVEIASNGNLFQVPNKTVVALGVEGLAVVETENALLICRMAEAERVKELVEKMEQDGHEELL